MTVLVDEKIGKQETRAWPDLLEGWSTAWCFMVPLVAASLEEETPFHVSIPAPRETEAWGSPGWPSSPTHSCSVQGGVWAKAASPRRPVAPSIPKPVTPSPIRCQPWAASPTSADSGKAGQVVSLAPTHPPGQSWQPFGRQKPQQLMQGGRVRGHWSLLPAGVLEEQGTCGLVIRADRAGLSGPPIRLQEIGKGRF